MRTPAAQLLELLDPIPGELTRAHAMAGSSSLAATQKGQALAPEQAASIVVQRYFADAARALKQASSFAAAQADVLGLEAAAALRDCVTVLIAIESGAAPANALPETAQAVALRVRALRDALATPVRLVAGALQASEVELGGDLEITGRGVIGCTLEVRGDVLIEGDGLVAARRGAAPRRHRPHQRARFGRRGADARAARPGRVALRRPRAPRRHGSRRRTARRARSVRGSATSSSARIAEARLATRRSARSGRAGARAGSARRRAASRCRPRAGRSPCRPARRRDVVADRDDDAAAHRDLGRGRDDQAGAGLVVVVASAPTTR